MRLDDDFFYNPPPPPLPVYMRQSFQDFAAMFVKVVLASLIIAGVVWPWEHTLACIPFVVLFLAGAWVLAGRRAQ